MIKVRKIHPSGALEIGALVRELPSQQVWWEHKTYFGYDKTEARKDFIIHLNNNKLSLVND